MGQPLTIIRSTRHGSFTGAGGLVIPFGFKGRQSLIFVGEESGASVAVKMTVLPYMPQAQTSAYGGLPGTPVSFYASGFARDEVVHVYIGHEVNNASNMVSCFRTDDRGNVGARSEEHTSELQSHLNLVCRLLLEKKKNRND